MLFKFNKTIARSDPKYFNLLQFFATIVILWALFQSYSWHWWVAGYFAYFVTGCLGVTVTFHRYLTHRSYQLPLPLEYIFSFFGAMGGTGSSIGWASVHYLHHKFSDKPGDPHNPFGHAVKEWFPNFEIPAKPIFALKHLYADRFHMFLHRYYYWLFLSWGALIALFFGSTAFIFLFVMPIFMQRWTMTLSNFGNHKLGWGYRTYDTNDHSVNSWWLAILFWGEGWHNNHHAEPRNWSFNRKWWEFDITGQIIKLVRANKV